VRKPSTKERKKKRVKRIFQNSQNFSNLAQRTRDFPLEERFRDWMLGNEPVNQKRRVVEYFLLR
jgi:hypothetical protein